MGFLSHGIYYRLRYGISIALIIHSLDPSLITQFIARYQDLYGNSIAVTNRSLDHSLFAHLIYSFV